MSKKRVVIVGAGYAGVHLAKKLDRKLKGSQVEILLINKGPYHTLLTDLHEVAGNRIRPEGVQVFLPAIFKGTNVQVIQDEIQSVDCEKQVVSSASREYHYDFLVLACGSEPAFYGIPGMKEHSFTLWSYEDALRIKEHVVEMFRLASREEDPSKRKELLTFVIGGGGFTGVEMAGELAEWVPELCAEYGIPQHEVNLILVEALPTILPNLRGSLIPRAVRAMQAKGITVFTNSPIVEVSSEEVVFKSGTRIKTRTLIWTGGVQAKEAVKGLGFKCSRRGRIQVNEHLQVVDHLNIYAVGDNACFVNEEGELPALVEAALQAADCVAENIKRQIEGKPQKEFKPNLHGVMVSIGSKYAVADVMGFPSWGPPAMALKHLVNLHYLFGVGGFPLITRYLRLEFLNERGGLAGLYNHFVAKTPAFWLAILRIFLGIQWLISGIHKVQAGFLVSGDKLVSGSSLVPMGPGTPAWYAAFMEKVVFPHALLFQRLITLGELALGIAFILGLFTSLAALGSIFMNLNFMLSGTGNIWFLVVSVAMLGGAGYSFGLDHYLMPFLKGFYREWRYGGAKGAPAARGTLKA